MTWLMGTIVSLLFLLLMPSSSLAKTDAECIPRDGNPFGDTCDGCDGQFFMNADCTQGYVCSTSGDGCLYECEGEYDIMLPHFESGTFECADNSNGIYKCPGEYKIHCEGDPIPDLPLTWSECECDSQLWVSPDCKQGFSCRNGVPGDGYFWECTESNEIISVDWRTWNWGCQPDEGQCPPGGGFALGCTSNPVRVPTQCYNTQENPLGTCECGGQVFLSDDCSQAFECIDDDGHPMINDGCLYQCDEHEIMVPDFNTGLYFCQDNTENVARCIGQWKLHCENDPVEFPIIPEEDCVCDGQLWVSDDCSQGFSCRESADNGGYGITCNDGDIITVDLRTWNWGCRPDNGNCPGGGGFSVGCENGPIRIPTEGQAVAENPIGTCECEDQVFMSMDCKQGFKCSSASSQEGMLYNCEPGQLMIPEFSTGLFMCVENEFGDGVCPGEMQTFCPDASIELSEDLCQCDGQLWVSEGCSEAFQCQTRIGTGGYLLECPAGETVQYGAGFIETWECAPGSPQCPDSGGYKLGCPFGTTPEPTTTTEAMTVAPVQATCITRDTNPIGDCDDCDGQLFMSFDCSQAYVCGENCLYECEGEYDIMLPHFEDGTFQCLDNSAGTHRCPGPFKIHCSNDPIPDLPLTSSQCDCDGQLWVSPDCKQGFSCREDAPGGGYYHECSDPGEIISVDLRTWNWGCQPDEGQCPGGGGFSLGCEAGAVRVPTTCYPSVENPIGLCECDGQVFLNDECNQAFQCIDNDDYALINDGCLYECKENEIMVPEFSTGLFLCMDNTENDGRCIGQWKLHCEDDPVDFPIDPVDDCVCDGQLWVSDDCSQGFSCRESADNGGYGITCDDGDIISVDLRTWNWGCRPDNGNCPGGGGFSVGCDNGPIRIPTEGQAAAENPIGTCQCLDQVFMDTDCKQAYKCTADGSQDGMLYECGDDELMIPEFSTGLFMCIDNTFGDGVCPGQFQTFCDNDPVDWAEFECECNGQLWVSSDCSQAYQCRTNTNNNGFFIPCPDGETIHYGAGFINDWECAEGTAQCPGEGGYKLGCPNGPDPPVDPTSTTTDPPGGGDGGGGSSAMQNRIGTASLMSLCIFFKLFIL